MESVRQPDMGSVELCLICRGANPIPLYNRMLAQWLYRFGSVRILSEHPRPEHFPGDLHWSKTPVGEPMAESWNRAVWESDFPWVLIMEHGERLVSMTAANALRLEPGNSYTVSVEWARGEEPSRIYQQIRLIHGQAETPFEGVQVPDATRYLHATGGAVLPSGLSMIRENHPFEEARSRPDIPGEVDTPSWKLMMGERALDRAEPVVATSHFRTLLSRESLLPFDRLSAMNGLASGYAEQQRWDRAMELAGESITLQSRQWLPYLIRYRLLDLSGEKGAARQELEHYMTASQQSSRASMDRKVAPDDAVRRMVRLDIGMGDLKRALDGLDHLVEWSRGGERHRWSMKAIRVALQARDRVRTRRYLTRLQTAAEKDSLTREGEREMELLMEGMAQEGWYDLLLPVYEAHRKREPENELYRRRLIVALSRTGHLERARELMKGQ